MTDHPITPPPELVERWYDTIDNSSTSWKQELATQAARWGADQELEACCEWLKAKEWIHPEFSDELRAVRRPKPPSLKEQALSDFDGLMSELDGAGNYSNCAERIRRALEQLDD